MRKKTISFFISIFFFVLVPFNTFSQTPLFKNYSVKDGLPSSETYRVHQDSRGYIWVVGDMGVSRFDGYKFQNYTTKDGLPENTILGLYEDYKHRIWFWSLSGQLAYFENEKIHPLMKVNQEIKTKFKGGIINSIALDKNDTLHLGVFHIRGIYKVFYDGKNESLVIDTKTQRGTYIKEINNSKKEVLITENIESHSTNLKFYKFRKINTLGSNEKTLSSNPNRKCIRLKNGNILLSLDKDVWEITPKGKMILRKHFDQAVLYLKEESDGTMWIGVYKKGVYSVRKRTE